MTDNTNLRHLNCGHTVPVKDHRWVTIKGADACNLHCLEKLERRGA